MVRSATRIRAKLIPSALTFFQSILPLQRERNHRRQQKIKEAREADPAYIAQMEEKERLQREKLLESERKRAERANRQKKLSRKELKEAAMLDGANLIQQIRTVEWPAIKDMVVIQFILQAGNIMSIGFEKAYALQTDLNLDSAEIIATYVYKKGLLDGDYSFSTAVGLFNTVINVILLIAVNKVVAKMNDGQGL